MSDALTSPMLLVAVAMAGIGLAMHVHARVQSKLLRSRIVHGVGTVVIDPSTCLYSAAAAWQSIRAEGNRATRLGRPVDVWIGSHDDVAALEDAGRMLAGAMPAGATGIRIDRNRICVLACVDLDAAPTDLAPTLGWRAHRIDRGSDDPASEVLLLLAERSGAAPSELERSA